MSRMKNDVLQVVSDKIVFVGEIDVGGMRFHFRLRIFARGEVTRVIAMTARGICGQEDYQQFRVPQQAGLRWGSRHLGDQNQRRHDDREDLCGQQAWHLWVDSGLSLSSIVAVDT